MPQSCAGFRLNIPLNSGGGYFAALETAINQLVAAKQTTQGPRDLTGLVGLIQRFQALNELTARSASFEYATWILRLLLLTCYCFPVIIMMLGNTSGYERLIAKRQCNLT
jgi:hypothetical protein